MPYEARLGSQLAVQARVTAPYYSSDRNTRQEMKNQTATAASHTAAVRSTLPSEDELYMFVEFGEYMNQPP